MVTEIRIPITSSEIGILWMTYQRKVMMKILVNHLIDTSENEESKRILVDFTAETEKHIFEMENIFNEEKAVLPISFNHMDVFIDTPPLFQDMFSIIFLRLLMKLDMAGITLNLSMSYRKT